jgi:Mg/Co/Ni transporter MgtE
MSAASVEVVLADVQSWPREQRLELVRSLNRATACERMDEVAQRVRKRALAHPLTDDEIDAAVREVRRERPLHLRSST